MLDFLKSLTSVSALVTNNYFSEANADFPTMYVLTAGFRTWVSCLVQFPGWKDLVSASWLYQANRFSKEGLILISPHATLIQYQWRIQYLCCFLCTAPSWTLDLEKWLLYRAFSSWSKIMFSDPQKDLGNPSGPWKSHQLWTVTFWPLAPGAIPCVRVWQWRGGGKMCLAVLWI